MKPLNEIVKEARIEKGLTQSELGDALGVKKSTVSLMESGKTSISLEKAQILKNVLGLDREIFLH